MKKILIVGAGQYGSVARDVATDFDRIEILMTIMNCCC